MFIVVDGGQVVYRAPRLSQAAGFRRGRGSGVVAEVLSELLTGDVRAILRDSLVVPRNPAQTTRSKRQQSAKAH